jgi:tRNA A37 threonylcarbamoyladenosine dehydratase
MVMRVVVLGCGGMGSSWVKTAGLFRAVLGSVSLIFFQSPLNRWHKNACQTSSIL